ncbi:MAG: TSUP family transporter [Gammaproteobacteria bacterium]|nr:TSUP family transporter [Gammaproteobacteria bacterium]MCF6363919.1 TSUP family transporter [Gammaproteobacteria bacterium]
MPTRNPWCRKQEINDGPVDVLIALAGSFTYVLIGWNAEGLPPAALGFVYLPALLGVVVASVMFAPLGARLAHNLSGPALKRVFALCLALLGLWMLLG